MPACVVLGQDEGQGLIHKADGATASFQAAMFAVATHVLINTCNNL